METVKNGLFVSVDYKGTLGNGEIFDSSNGRLPLEIKIGADQLIKGFEDALLGMSLNEKKHSLWRQKMRMGCAMTISSVHSPYLKSPLA